MKLPDWIHKILRREPAKTILPSMSVKETFLEFLNKPCVDNFLAVRQKMAESDRYLPYSNEPIELAFILSSGDPQAAIECFWRTFPSLLLSPSAHMTLSKAYNSMGKENEAAFEKALAHQLIKSILATGKGTKKKPYAVMRVEDERDVLAALRKQPGPQFLMMDKNRVLDLLQCSDGSEVYFDITLMFGRGRKRDSSGLPNNASVHPAQHGRGH
jgi:hypothetical protein